jgi:hypothetical protein
MEAMDMDVMGMAVMGRVAALAFPAPMNGLHAIPGMTVNRIRKDRRILRMEAILQDLNEKSING